jgi:glycine/D-amino acid oxidase-like deaminating enzyme/nitrite reductase/ring-hydroxylating ferredoxin subunit
MPDGSTSVWMATAQPAYLPTLDDSVQADVCVIGGGIAGLTAAYLLCKEGRSVVLVEASNIGSGETGRTTAHFFPPDNRYYFIEESFGAEAARLTADSFARATDRVEEIVHEEGIQCGFERLDGYLFSLQRNGYENLKKEHEAALRAGAKANMYDQVPGVDFDSGPCVQFGNLAQFHPLNYLYGLCAAIGRLGGRIYVNTRALQIDNERNQRIVTTERASIRAKDVVVATNTPFNNRLIMHTKQAAFRSYVLGLRVPCGSVPRMLLWDDGDPYYYVRLESPVSFTDDILIVGGQDHKSGQDGSAESHYEAIENWTRARFPMAMTVEYKWSGIVMEPADGIAFLGQNPHEEGVYIITGDSGNGMTHCTAGAMLITDLIMGRHNPWAELYSPSRKVIHGTSHFIRDQLNTLAQYGKWAGGGKGESVETIPAGQGAVIRDGLGKQAVYRDSTGLLHALSATCPHLGCEVAWNSAEKSWDCPCHGSRFDINGKVLHGPAATPLAAVKPHEKAA